MPVPGGVESGIVTSVEVGGSGSSGTVVAFWTGGSTLVITETISLTIDSTGSRGFVVVGAAVVVVGVVDSLTTPVGAITIPVLEVVVVGARETGAESDAGSGSEVGGFEIGIAGPSDGWALGCWLGCWLNGASDVKVGSGFVTLLLPNVGFGGTKTVLWITTVVTAAATLGNGRSVRLSIRSERLDCRFVGVEDASSELGAGLSKEVMVALEYCRLTCRGKYILFGACASWPATDAAATRAATKAEVVRILYSKATRHAVSNRISTGRFGRI